MALLGFLNNKTTKGKKPVSKTSGDITEGTASVASTMAVIPSEAVVRTTKFRAVQTKRRDASVSLHTLLYPSVTEKSTRSNGSHPCVTFIVERTATKSDVRRAIVEVYGVVPLSIQILNEPERRYRTRVGGDRVKRGLKKAMVNLPPGTEIDVTKVPHA